MQNSALSLYSLMDLMIFAITNINDLFVELNLLSIYTNQNSLVSKFDFPRLTSLILYIVGLINFKYWIWQIVN